MNVLFLAQMIDGEIVCHLSYVLRQGLEIGQLAGVKKRVQID
jgi:hypothetical protein